MFPRPIDMEDERYCTFWLLNNFWCLIFRFGLPPWSLITSYPPTSLFSSVEGILVSVACTQACVVPEWKTARNISACPPVPLDMTALELLAPTIFDLQFMCHEARRVGCCSLPRLLLRTRPSGSQDSGWWAWASRQWRNMRCRFCCCKLLSKFFWQTPICLWYCIALTP